MVKTYSHMAHGTIQLANVTNSNAIIADDSCNKFNIKINDEIVVADNYSSCIVHGNVTNFDRENRLIFIDNKEVDLRSLVLLAVV